MPEVHGREWSGRLRHQGGRHDARHVSGSTTASSSSPITKRSTTRRMVAEADLIVDTRNAIKTPARKVFKLGAPRPEAETVEA